jgi:hypothetical protein
MLSCAKLVLVILTSFALEGIAILALFLIGITLNEKFANDTAIGSMVIKKVSIIFL